MISMSSSVQGDAQALLRVPVKLILADVAISSCLGPKQRTMLDENHGSITHQRRQPSNQAHKTISPRRELAAARQRRQLSPRLHSLPTLPGTHLPPWLPLITSDDPKDVRYPGAAWNPPIRSSTCRDTSPGTPTSASWNTSHRAWRTSRAGQLWATSGAPHPLRSR